MTSHHETYGQAARKRRPRLPQARPARKLLAVTSNGWEVDGLLRRAIHDLTVGVD